VRDDELHYYLSLHSTGFMSGQKELEFLLPRIGLAKGVDWYKAQFPSTAEICGDSSPAIPTYPFWGGGPGSMALSCMHTKLIYLLRDPSRECFPNYVHEVRRRP